MRTIGNNRGDVIETTLTDAEAIQLIRRFKNRFCQQLANQYDASRADGTKRGLSEAQWYWAHKYALEGENPSRPVITRTPEYVKIIALFQRAIQHTSNPIIRLSLPTEPQVTRQLVTAVQQTVVLGYGGATSRFPGTVTVTDGGPYGRAVFYGRIDKDGGFARSNNCPGAVAGILRCLCDDPAGVALRHGRQNNKCPFCDGPLNDERSARVGYGPQCAVVWGLPWGEEEEYDEHTFDHLIQEADREDSRRAAEAKWRRDIRD